jgi:hypothetical protein
MKEFSEDWCRLLCVITRPFKEGLAQAVKNRNCVSRVPPIIEWINQLQKCNLVTGWYECIRAILHGQSSNNVIAFLAEETVLLG